MEDDYWNTSFNKSFSFDDDDNKSEVSNVSVSTSTISLHMIISDSDLQQVLDDQMLTEPILPKVTLEEEVKILRRKLMETQYLSIGIAVNKLLLGKPCNLTIYKSLKEKQELLDAAILSGNGDAILEVVIFLKDTLKPTLFMTILKTRPAAVDHYVEFLSTTMRIAEAAEILTATGRIQEAALLQFKAAVFSKNVMKKLEQMKTIQEIINQPGCNPFFSHQVSNYCRLLELQINERLYYQPNDILEKSVIETLYFSAEKFQKWGEPNASSNATNPYKIVEAYNVTQAQFEWIALNSRGKSQAWKSIEELFERKTVLKKKSFVIHIPLELAIIRLHQLRAPQAVLNTFLQHVEEPDRRLSLSKKVGAINSIIESLVLLKNKSGLEEFKETLASGTAEYFNAEKALENLSITKSLLGLTKSSNTS